MHFFDASPALHLKNKEYLRCVEQHTLKALQEDEASGDLTTRFFLDQPKRPASAVVVAKEPGILAGIPEATWFLGQCGIRVSQERKEGGLLKRRDGVMRLTGRADDLLRVERTLINLLQRMSGVATATRRLADRLPPRIPLLATRKTLWGLLDKRAVVVGGGWTHRLNLSDAILIKDNHLRLAPDWESALVNVFRNSKKVRFVEVEVEKPDQALRIQTIYEMHGRRYSLIDRFAILLDNFSPKQVAELAPKLAQSGIFVEASGGIDGSNITKYLVRGVSAISSGAITNRAAALDMSLEIV